MCGISTVCYKNAEQRVDRQTLDQMNGTLFHRGPDDSGIHISGSIGMAFRRLSIIDLSQDGHQPMSNEDRSVWMVYNGEIYNHRALRRTLMCQGHRFKSKTDSEVIIHLYEEHGSACLDHLDGMFAFVIWDERRQELFAARDRFGIKPLHIYEDGEKVLLASEIKAILAHPETLKRFDYDAFWNYLTFEYVPAPQTIYRDIRKVLPGWAVRIKGGQVHHWQYWDPTISEDHQVSENEWGEALHACLRASVKTHLISDVPVGVFLSGGLDSSALVAFASELNGEPVKTFSISFEGDKEYDESPYQQLVANTFGTDHYEVRVKPDILGVAQHLMQECDEPFAIASAVPLYYIAKLASEHVKVVLGGEGGDELFAGYTYRYALAKRLDVLDLMPPFVWRFFGRLFQIPGGNAAWLQRSRRVALQGAIGPDERYIRLFNFYTPEQKIELLHPDILDQMKRNYGPYIPSILDSAPTNGLNRKLYFDTKLSLPDEMLTKVDRVTSMVSIEGRVPLLDKAFAELALKIPASLKLQNGEGKYIFKESLRSTLPDEIIDRKKQGFNVPLDPWFRRELGSESAMSILAEGALDHSIFRPDCVNQLLTDQRNGIPRGHLLWILHIFQVWYDTQERRGLLPTF